MAARLFLGLSLGVILLLTLEPLPAQAYQSAATPFLCVLCGSQGTADFILNIALFVPFGLALWARGVRRSHAIAVIVLLTSVVEGLQYTVIFGRDASLGDLVSNAIGGWVGYTLGARWREWVLPPVPAARRLLMGWGTFVAAVLVATPLALRPTLPSGTWYGQWAVDGPEEGWFDGTVIRAELGTEPLVHWRLKDTPERRQRLLGSPIRLRADILSGNPPPEPQRIVSVASDSLEDRFITLSQDGRDLRFGVRVRGNDFGLRSPTVRLPESLPSGRGERVSVEGSVRAGVVEVVASGQAGLRQASFGLGLLDGWVLLLPVEIRQGWRRAGLPGAWGLGLFLPLVWWAALASGPRRRRAPDSRGVVSGKRESPGR